MRRISMAVALAGLAMSAIGVAAPPQSISAGGDLRIADRPNRRGKGQNNKRGRGHQAKPKKHSNRLTISKRVRRKHRRAV